MKNQFRRLEKLGGTALLVLIVAGCALVLRPFTTSILFAAVLCYSCWPLYQWMLLQTGGRKTLCSAVMTFLVALLLILPFATAGYTLATAAREILARLRDYQVSGLPDLPGWIGRIPVVGETIVQHWMEWSNDSASLFENIRQWSLEAQSMLVQHSMGLVRAAVELGLSVFITYFMFHAGETLVTRVSEVVNRAIGDLTQHLLAATGTMVRGVVYGILGTALAQGSLLAIGFLIAGLPSAFFFGIVTFFLALIPFGCVFVWLPAALHLFTQGEPGWAVFVAIWGFFVVSGVDNVLRPYLISRESRLPFIIVLLGVLGGIFAFGFIGIFLGPVLLAMLYRIAYEIARIEREPAPPPAPVSRSQISNLKSEVPPSPAPAEPPA